MLVDETADTIDVSATIVDLAVRGFLRIEEVTNSRGKVTDHRLIRLAKNDALLPYEQLLLTHLFSSGPAVEMKHLKNKFASKLHAVKSALYDDVVGAGYFPRRPDQVRQKWTAVGFLSLAACVGVLVFAVAKTHYAVVAAPLVLAGLALAIGATVHAPAHGTRHRARTGGRLGSRTSSKIPRSTEPVSRKGRTSSLNICPMQLCSVAPRSGLEPSNRSVWCRTRRSTSARGRSFTAGSATPSSRLARPYRVRSRQRLQARVAAGSPVVDLPAAEAVEAEEEVGEMDSAVRRSLG